MSNSREDRAKTANDQATSTATNYGAAATGVGSSLVPELTKEATNPTGMTPTEKNNLLVAGAQGAGGATAGITGQADLEAARTHNTGALSGVLDQAAREKTKALSNTTLGVANQDVALKEKQRQEGLAGLQGVYGTDVGAQLKAQGLVPEDINAENAAAQSGVQQNALNWFKAVKSGGGGGG